MKTLVTFCDMKSPDGITARLDSLISKWQPDYVISISISNKQYLRQTYVDNTLTEACSSASYLKITMSLLREWSFNSARLADFDKAQLAILKKSDEIFLHTARVYNKIPSFYRSKISKVDLCDDLVFTYRVSSLYYAKRFNFFLAMVYMWESFVEKKLILSLSNTKLSYIRAPSRFLSFNYDVFPNIIPKPIISYDFPAREKLRYGIIGNFRTIANKEIIYEAIKFRNIEPSDIYLFGSNIELVQKSFSGLNNVGPYKQLADIQDQFDVGLCLVQTQGGIQNKVLDYLCLGKIAVVSAVVQDAFLEDDFYREIVKSPLFVLDSEVSNSNLQELLNYKNISNNFDLINKMRFKFF
jgi:hypothetical protein